MCYDFCFFVGGSKSSEEVSGGIVVAEVENVAVRGAVLDAIVEAEVESGAVRGAVLGVIMVAEVEDAAVSGAVVTVARGTETVVEPDDVVSGTETVGANNDVAVGSGGFFLSPSPFDFFIIILCQFNA
mmetsp:Transcript_22132/g.53625  ORF Transcript_22132/g.53625 Transcript_22132/m.53625 type:complete len:128 (+) Transcript_22132:706-1089(+)